MPLVADIHFQPVVANMVAECFEKIRINPGNFVDGRKSFDEKVYDDDSQFKQEQEHIREVHVSHLHTISCLCLSKKSWRDDGLSVYLGQVCRRGGRGKGRGGVGWGLIVLLAFVAAV